MGFWDIAIKVGKFAVNNSKDIVEEVKEKSQEVIDIRDKYLEMSDDELLEISKDDSFFGNTATKQSIAKKILIDRGVL